MAPPEWMKRFEEIGQKGEEEVTAIENDGFVKTLKPSKRIDLDNTDAPVNRSSTGSFIGDKKERKDESSSIIRDTSESDVDDDAAAAYGRGGLVNNFQSKDETNKSCGDASGIEPEESSTVADEKVEENDNGGGDDDDLEEKGRRSPSGFYARLLSSPPKDDGDEQVGSDNITSMATTVDNDDDDQQQHQQPIDFGERWVVDHNEFSNNETENERNIVDETSMTTGTLKQSYMTDTHGDKYGNEVVTERNGNETQEAPESEEVYIDEDGNAIIPSNQFIHNNEEYGKTKHKYNATMQAYYDDTIDNVPSIVDRKLAGTTTSQMERNDEEAISRIETAEAYNNTNNQQRILYGIKKTKRSRMSWIVPILVFLLIASAILLVIFFVVLNEEKTASFVNPTFAPASTPTEYPPSNPTVSTSGNVDAAATTEFDPFQNSCDFDTSYQPSIIDQCECNGSIDTLADDVIIRWNYYKENVVANIYPEWNESVDSCSSENQALLWLSSGINNGGEINSLRRTQRYILAVVYYHQGGIDWRRSTNWLSEENVCVWEGVECNESSYVRILNLDRNWLTGILSDAPALLSTIEGYSVANNSLIGSIPKSYFASETLRSINFSGNALSGKIPSISRRNRLIEIDLGSNRLKGPIPTTIGNADSLTVFNVESNALSGTLPLSLFDLPFKDLAIGDNEFTGTIPSNISGASLLTSLSLGPNLFVGEIPTSLSELTNLVRLSMNGIPNLSGRLPATFGISLTNMAELSISGTSVNGDIPEQFSLMTNLEILRLNNNSLARNIPSSLSLLTNLRSLHLNDNALTGLLPSQIGLLSRLQELQLHTNRFIGSIPNEIGNLVNIRSITLDGNFMVGRVSNHVCDLRNYQLSVFVVGCPSVLGDSQTVVGIICNIPDCCTGFVFHLDHHYAVI